MKVKNFTLVLLSVFLGLSFVSCDEEERIWDIYPIKFEIFLVDENNQPLFLDYTVEQLSEENISATFNGETYPLSFYSADAEYGPYSRYYLPQFHGLVVGYEYTESDNGIMSPTVNKDKFSILFGELDGAESSHHQITFNFPKYNKSVEVDFKRNFKWKNNNPVIKDVVYLDGKPETGQSFTIVLPSTDRID